MHHMKKQFYFLAALCTLPFTACTPKSDSARNENPPEANDRLVNEEHSLNVFDKLSPLIIPANDGTKETAYADFYGGAYLDDKGKLTVLIKGKTEEIKEKLSELADSSAFTVKSCKYSFNELKEMKRKLAEKINDEELSKRLGWENAGIRISENKIAIGLRGYSEQRVEQFKKEVADSDMLLFYPLLGSGVEILIPEDSIPSK